MGCKCAEMHFPEFRRKMTPRGIWIIYFYCLAPIADLRANRRARLSGKTPFPGTYNSR